MITEREHGRIHQAALSMAMMQRKQLTANNYDLGWNAAILQGIAMGLSIGLDTDGSFDVVDATLDYFTANQAELQEQADAIQTGLAEAIAQVIAQDQAAARVEDAIAQVADQVGV